MNWMREVARRLRMLMQRRQFDADLEEEMRLLLIAYSGGWHCPSDHQYRTPVAIILSCAGALVSASRVGRNFQAIPTKLHAAPASCPFLAGVLEMQHALAALADALAIHCGE